MLKLRNVAVLGAVVFAAFVIWGNGWLPGQRVEKHRDSVDPFGDVQPYLQMVAVSRSYDRPFRTGKILVIDMDNARLDPVHTRLPIEIRATKPEEVATVAQVRCGTQLVLGCRYTHSCKVEMIDLATKAHVGTWSVTAGELLPGMTCRNTAYPPTEPRPDYLLALRFKELPLQVPSK